MRKLKWGILSTAKIGLERVIPGMLKSELLEVHGIASRDANNTKKVADQFGIEKSYGSYDVLLADPAIDIVYNPLPNHMHVEWTAKAIEAGKHVLCEKPLFLNEDEISKLIKLRDTHQVKVGEAFMVKSHPQWIKTKEIIDSGELGDVSLYNGTFCYFNTDENNIRNIAAFGGGALWDIGCYPVMTAKYLFGENPIRILGHNSIDPKFNTDVLSTGIMEFSKGKRAVFTVSTQLAPYQRVHLLGTQKELEIKIPFNAPNDRKVNIEINSSDVLLEKIQIKSIDICDQYQLEAEDFTKAIINNQPVPVSLEDAADHCRIINALFRSAKNGEWVTI